jgi:adenine-specific DNA-methyltransferase
MNAEPKAITQEFQFDVDETISLPWSDCEIFQGDALKLLNKVADESVKLCVTSPPYNIGKEYERDHRRSLDEYFAWIDPIIEKLCSKIHPDGHICWQTGNFVEDGEVFPLDLHFYELFKSKGFKLRNRIIWHFNFGLNATTRFSGRYETLLWFTRGDAYTFNLDSVRIPQLYPGKRHAASKGARAGKPSGNPKGKNPSDVWVFDPDEAFRLNPVWDFPNVKSKHPEKTGHPCQFPSELVERCVLALTHPGDLVLDPFVGSGTTAIASLLHQRACKGFDRDKRYAELARERVALLKAGKLRTRPLGKPVRRPKPTEKVARVPEEWQLCAEREANGKATDEEG